MQGRFRVDAAARNRASASTPKSHCPPTSSYASNSTPKSVVWQLSGSPSRYKLAKAFQLENREAEGTASYLLVPKMVFQIYDCSFDTHYFSEVFLTILGDTQTIRERTELHKCQVLR